MTDTSGAFDPEGFSTQPPEPLVFGLCSAISARTGSSVVLVRSVAVTLGTAGGLGLVLYLVGNALWRTRDVQPKPADPASDVGLILTLVGILWLAAQFWPGVEPALVIPVGLVSIGIALGWKSTPTASTGNGHRSPTSVMLRSAALRIVGGLVLCIAGLAVVLGRSADLASIRDTSLALAVALTGIGLVLGPTVVSILGSFTAERDGRIRASERARVASHLHDSVLQTLTLIQKRADDPTEVAMLARHEERSLRRWLYASTESYDSEVQEAQSLTWQHALETVVDEVEGRYDVAIELVMVGNTDHVDGSESALLLAAAREAMVNAAKFSGKRHVSVYCECSTDHLSLYVRDRGAGFVAHEVPEDRRGIRDSILTRMHEAGGTAVINSTPGVGTEVSLSLPVRHSHPVSSTGQMK